MKPKIIVYLPVIHRGYLKFFENHSDADIFIINENLIELIDQEFDYLRKEIRALTPSQAESSLEALLPDRKISLLGANDLMLLDNLEQKIILPKEDIFVWLAENYMTKSQTIFDETFLRWNRENLHKASKMKSGKEFLEKEFGEKLIKLVEKTKTEAELSSDWWRQVGAVVFDESSDSSQNEKTMKSKNLQQSTKPKLIAIAHNHHLPSPYAPYIDSDPRNSFHQGKNIDLSTAIHAEAALIADCAKKGISLSGKSIYTTTFPCPTCAKLIAVSGIAKLYYSEGYSMLDGEKVLADTKVKIFRL